MFCKSFVTHIQLNTEQIQRYLLFKLMKFAVFSLQHVPEKGATKDCESCWKLKQNKTKNLTKVMVSWWRLKEGVLERFSRWKARMGARFSTLWNTQWANIWIPFDPSGVWTESSCVVFQPKSTLKINLSELSELEKWLVLVFLYKRVCHLCGQRITNCFSDTRCCHQDFLVFCCLCPSSLKASFQSLQMLAMACRP